MVCKNKCKGCKCGDTASEKAPTIGGHPDYSPLLGKTISMDMRVAGGVETYHFVDVFSKETLLTIKVDPE